MSRVIIPSRLRMFRREQFAAAFHVTAVIARDSPRNAHSMSGRSELLSDEFPRRTRHRMQADQVQVCELQSLSERRQFALSHADNDAQLERADLHRVVNQQQPVGGHMSLF